MSEEIKILRPVRVSGVRCLCEEAGEKLALYLMAKLPDFSWRYDTEVGIHIIKDMPDDYKAWLVKKGFIEIAEPFEPFYVKVTTKDEIVALWHRLNIHTSSLDAKYFEKYGITEDDLVHTRLLWHQVNDRAKEIGLKIP